MSQLYTVIQFLKVIIGLDWSDGGGGGILTLMG